MADQDIVRAEEQSGQAEAIGLPPGIPLPISLTVSGLYATPGISAGAESETAGAGVVPIAPLPIPLFGEELRLDVDGRFPQMTASGTIPVSKVQRLTWIAKLQAAGPHHYTGGIWYKEPAAVAFGYKTVDITVTVGPIISQRHAKVTFSGPGLPQRVRTFAFRSPYFHPVQFEYDCETGVAPDVVLATCAHPNHPASLPCENLSLVQVYQRAGFDASITPSPSIVGTAPGGTWSDMEMHDAMQTYWSKFANKPQWAFWVLFAKQHDMGHSLGGIMFDDIGPNQRQGTAIFYNSFISDQPAGDPNPAASVKRLHFWTAAHEMGHTFNLAHSWQKALGTPWIALTNEPEARSFMNYPYNVAGGQTAFFANFDYRFSDSELLFMRHSPLRFVRQGDADWFVDHGFQQVALSPEPKFSLEVRVNRPKPVFEFLEPVVAELKLKNVSDAPQIIDGNVLTTLDGITLVTQREGSKARQHVPYARYCMKATPKVLQPGEAIYNSVYITAGLNGIALAEPGRYIVQAALHQADGDILSNPLIVRISRPREAKDELLAQDFLQPEVARVLAFDGSRVLTDATDTLREVTAQLADRRVARHARIPLGLTVATPSRVAIAVAAEGGRVSASRLAEIQGARPDEARTELNAALMTEPDVAAESLGHIDYRYYMEKLSDLLSAQHDKRDAVQVLNTLHQILAARGVLPSVLKEIDQKRDGLQATTRASKA